MNVVLASDDKYFSGLSGAALSVAFNSSVPLNIYIIDGGIKDKSFKILEKYIVKHLKHVKLHRVFPELSKLNGVKKDNGNGVSAYIRVLVGTLLPSLDKVVYVDSDFYFGKDIAELKNISFDGNVAMVVQDTGEKVLSNDCPVLDEYNLNPETPYFNSGFMYIDLDKWRENEIESKTLELLHSHSHKFRCYDQTALNAILPGKLKYIDLKWNDHRYFPVLLEHDSLDVNFHMFGPQKPWNGYPLNTYHLVYQLLITRLGYGNLNYRRILYRDYFKFKLNKFLLKLQVKRQNNFWTSLFDSHARVLKLFKQKYSKWA